jgi:hypothetical protein
MTLAQRWQQCQHSQNNGKDTIMIEWHGGIWKSASNGGKSIFFYVQVPSDP